MFAAIAADGLVSTVVSVTTLDLHTARTL